MTDNKTEKELKVTNNSFKQAGIIDDYREMLCQYIWNGFDAKATQVKVTTTDSGIGGIGTIIINDNGNGISFETIEDTFGNFLDSIKATRVNLQDETQGKKGVGRFSFQKFGTKATWETVYESNEGKKYQYTITIDGSNKNKFLLSERVEVDSKKQTGTKVTLGGLQGIKKEDFESDYFFNYLKENFGWYLHLKRGEGKELCINDCLLDYTSMIKSSESKLISVKDSDSDITFNFKVEFIEWKSQIGSNYFYYFIDSNFKKKGKKTTLYNKNSINFVHSLYVISNYFDKFEDIRYIDSTKELGIFDKDRIFKKLLVELGDFLSSKQKEFVATASEDIIETLRDEELLPAFGDTQLEKQKEEDFLEVTRTMIKVQPRLFIGGQKLHRKSFLQMLNLLINSDERENVLKIIDSITQMSKEEREALVKVLEKTSLNRMVKTVKEIISRYKNINILEKLVFEYSLETNERDHIQKVMEECFWLFGEEYTLVSADKKFSDALLTYYVEILNKNRDKKDQFIINHEELSRRPDIFLARKVPTYGTESILEENTIVELKRPSVKVSMEVFRQIEDYMNLIIESSRFNGDTRIWKFYVIGKEIDKDILRKMEAKQKEGRDPFLVERVDNYSIYALKWDDVFQMFKRKYKHLLEQLDLDNEAIEREFVDSGVNFKENVADILTSSVIQSKQPVELKG